MVIVWTDSESTVQSVLVVAFSAMHGLGRSHTCTYVTSSSSVVSQASSGFFERCPRQQEYRSLTCIQDVGNRALTRCDSSRSFYSLTHFRPAQTAFFQAAKFPGKRAPVYLSSRAHFVGGSFYEFKFQIKKKQGDAKTEKKIVKSWHVWY